MSQCTVFQFKITLEDTEPAIWRIIQIADTCTFWDLHVAIQNTMGWDDDHLHHFEVVDCYTGSQVLMGIPDDDGFGGDSTLPGWNYSVADYITKNKKMRYLYDYGDSWYHLIEFEGTHDQETGIKYPVCIVGECACPPEDIGGILGYYNFLEIINNPDDEEYESMLAWVGGVYDAEHFDPKKIKFDSPLRRWKQVFADG